MGEDEPEFGANRHEIHIEDMPRYLDEHAMLPILHAAGRSGLGQVIVSEEDESLTLLTPDRQGFSRYDVTRNYMFGAVLRRASLFYRQEYGAGLHEARPGDQLLLVRQFDRKSRFRTDTLTAVDLGIQHQYEHLSERQRQLWAELLLRDLES